MRLSKLRRIPGVITFVALACVQTVFAQVNRVPPRFIDEWYDRRLLPVIVTSALLGLLATLLWLPQLLPKPHQNDNRRARIHALITLGLSLLILAVGLLIDITQIAQFGNQTYQFKELFSDVFLSRQTVVMLGIAAIVFASVIILWTRFLSEKFYRYMIISK
jgi:uncharacterized membrane protein YidH (DUF202 family)